MRTRRSFSARQQEWSLPQASPPRARRPKRALYRECRVRGCPRARTAAAAAPRLSTLDRHANQRAVLGPRAVVVLDALVAEELGEDEPGVGRAFADAAV